MSQSATFRKLAPMIWQESKDPSVYGFFELDVTEIADKEMILPRFLSTLNAMVLNHPELNSMIRFGRAVQRKKQMISVMVNIPDNKNADLSALTFDVCKDLTSVDLKEIILGKGQLIRSRKDPYLGNALKLLHYLPRPLAKIFLKIYITLIYDFDTRLGIRFVPKYPFGSVIVSNVGSLGIKKALLPLVSLARPAMLLSLGKATPEARVINNQICIREIAHIVVTFDHRLFDGSHAAKMLNYFENHFEKNDL